MLPGSARAAWGLREMRWRSAQARNLGIAKLQSMGYNACKLGAGGEQCLQREKLRRAAQDWICKRGHVMPIMWVSATLYQNCS